MRRIEPRRPAPDDPLRLGRRRSVRRRNDAAPLRLVCRAVPAVDEQVLAFEEVGELIPRLEIVRPPLEPQLVLLVLAPAQLDMLACALPGRRPAAVAARAAQDLDQAIAEVVRILIDASQNQRSPMCVDGESEQEVAFAAPRLPAEKRLVGLAEICLGLRPDVRDPPQRSGLLEGEFYCLLALRI